jgi:peroxiredoxin
MLEREKMHKSINGFFNFILLLFVCGTLAMAVPQNDSIPLTAQEVHPLAVGDSAPDGTLSTIKGKKVNFKKLVAKKHSVVIFYRGGWCPFCNLQMGQLVKIEPELEKMGYQILAISPDKPEKLKESLEKHHLKYTLLSDRLMEVSKKFKLAYRVSDETLLKMKNHGVDLDSNTGNNLHMLPVPAAFVIDQKGVIRFVYFNPDIKVRVNPDDLLKAAKEAKK